MTAMVLAHSPEWHADRRSYLGGSDAPVLTGDDPWTSPYDLWLEKMGEGGPERDSAVMRWGKRVEQVAAEIYVEETGRRIYQPDPEKVRRHRRYPFLGAHPDRLVRGEKRVVEVKSSWRPWDAVPDRVTVQVQHTMGVLGYDVADVALLTGFAGFKVYEIPRDDLMIERLFAVERAWWARHIVAGEPPARTGRYRDAVMGKDVMPASFMQADKVGELRYVRDATARLKARESNVEDWIKDSMAGALRLDGKDFGFTVTWKPWSKVTDETDWRAVAAGYRAVIEGVGGHETELDAIASLYTRPVEKGARPFRVTFKDVEPTSEEA